MATDADKKQQQRHSVLAKILVRMWKAAEGSIMQLLRAKCIVETQAEHAAIVCSLCSVDVNTDSY